MIFSVSGYIFSGKDTVGKIINYHACGGEETFTDLPGFLEYYEDAFRPNGPGYPFEVKKWATKLKQMVALIIGCSPTDFENREFKEKKLGPEWNKWVVKSTISQTIYRTFLTEEEGQRELTNWNNCTVELVEMTPRLLLQLIGTECGRNIIHPNIWVNSLMADYQPVKGGYPEYGIGPNGENIPIGYNTIEHIPQWIITDTRFPNEADAVKFHGGINIRVRRPETDPKDVTLLHESETALDHYLFDEVIINSGSLEDLSKQVELIMRKHKILL